jgi:DNA-binding transcriptional regulator YiaG
MWLVPPNSLDSLASPDYLWLVKAKPVELTNEQVHGIRRSLGMTQIEFGDLIGVTMMTVSRWERGFTKVSDAYSTTIRTRVAEYKKKVG